jgi:hypothetical protein
LYASHGRFGIYSRSTIHGTGITRDGEAAAEFHQYRGARSGEAVFGERDCLDSLILYLVELTIKIVALGTVPGNRRPCSSIAWLLLISEVALMGSQNMIDSSYLLKGNLKVGRHWKDSTSRSAAGLSRSWKRCLPWIGTPRRVTGRALSSSSRTIPHSDVHMQLLPSGPGYLTMPNLRLFTGLAHRAQAKVVFDQSVLCAR